MSLSIKTKLIALLLISLMLTGCGQKTHNPMQPAPTPSPKISEMPTLPNPPVIYHPAQLVFISDSIGTVKVTKSGGELLILRGPHNSGFTIDVSGEEISVSGKGQGKVIFVANNGNSMYFSRMWVTGLDSPSFAILPANSSIMFIKPGETVEIPIKVVPVGNFNQEVKLSAASSTKNIIPQLSSSGIPPFNATIRLKVTGWVGDGHYIKITGVSASKTVQSYIRLNNPVKQKENGLLSALFRIVWAVLLPVTVSFSIVLGTISGAVMGVVGVAMLSNPVTFFSPHVLDVIAFGPSKSIAVTQEFMKAYSSVSPFSGVSLGNGNMIGISTVAIGNNFKVLLPYVEISPILGKEMKIPIYIAGSGPVELNITAPSAVDVRVKPNKGLAPFNATIYLLAKKVAQKTGIIFKKTRPYTVTINASSSGYYETYRLYLKPVRKDYEVKLSSDVIYLEPGMFASVKAVVIRNNRFSPEEHSLKVATPDGIKAFVHPKTGRTPYVANVTFYTENAEMGKYIANIGGAKIDVIVGKNGYAVVTPKKVQTMQGTVSSFQVEIYSIKQLSDELKANIPFNHTVIKTGEYTYRIDVNPSKYTPPGVYKEDIKYGIHEIPVSMYVGGTPVVVEYDSVVKAGKGETKDVKLNLRYAGYSGEVTLNFTATNGIEAIPSKVVAHVPGETTVQIKNINGVYGAVSFSGVVIYNGTPYGISGRMNVVPSGSS